MKLQPKTRTLVFGSLTKPPTPKLIQWSVVLLLTMFAHISMAQYPPSHDPTKVVRNTDGRYWIFTTGNGIWAMSSSNSSFSNWRAESTPFTPGTWPSWINNYVPGFQGDFWAPGVIQMNGYYYLYYSCSTFGSSRSAIGVTRASNLNGPWTDLGVVVSSNGSSNAINAIDPALFQDSNGSVWMSYGSWFGGIGVVQINPSTGKTTGGVTQVAGGNHQDREAPFIMKNGSYYYLFTNRGSCCNGLSSSYYIVVARSTSVTGPYTGERTFISNQNGNVVGPGHFGYGEGRLTYHFYDGNDNGNAKLRNRSDFGFANGWPYVGSPPSSGGPVTSGGTYRITPRHSGKAIDVVNCGSSNGTNVNQWSWLNNNCQKWIFTDVGGGYYRISPSNAPNMALDLDGCSGSNSANIQLWTWLNNDCQKWQLVDRGGGYYSIRSRASNKCMDISGVSTADGANVMQYTCYSSSYNQQFRFESASSNRVAEVSEVIDDQLGVYPNPVEDELKIHVGSHLEGTTQVRLYDSSGRLVKEDEFQGALYKMNVSALPKGLYLLNYENAKGTYSQKISKK